MHSSQAPGRLCDFWPTESLWAYVKKVLTKKVSKSPAFKKGVGALQWAEREKQRKDGERLKHFSKSIPI